jgi:hypothetical protein
MNMKIRIPELELLIVNSYRSPIMSTFLQEWGKKVLAKKKEDSESKGVFQGVSLDSLKFSQGPPCTTTKP